jgi:hypothetical protein
MHWPRWRLPNLAALPIAIIANSFSSAAADAHVKWFCAYNVAGQPEGLENVLCPDFETLTGHSVLALMTRALVEGNLIGAAMIRALDRVTRYPRENTEVMFRAATAFFHFYLSLWLRLVDPRVKNTVKHCGRPPTRFCCRRVVTAHHAAFGRRYLCDLWHCSVGIWNLDYPILLGIAVYPALTGLQRDI